MLTCFDCGKSKILTGNMQCLCDLKLVIENHILAIINRYTVMFP